ncbi:MAG: type III-A CRISPR-associated RAMP protein Csm4 [Chloroflexota bacterium]
MDWYRLRLQTASPTATPWQADTIFGHLCWALVFLEGEDFLRTFLELYDLGEPPLVLSNGFPGDLLPRPLLGGQPASRAGDSDADQETYRRGKELRRAIWLTESEFDRARRGEEVTPRAESPWRNVVTMHNQINRVTGTTGEEGSLYARESQALAGPGHNGEESYGSVTVYALVDPGFTNTLQRCLDYLGATGYGKRKSVGFGALSKPEPERFAGFPPIDGANGFMSLSNFVPAKGDPVRGAWRTLVKRGKLGEHLARTDNPFKRPVVMLEAGSCFYDSPVRSFYGRLVKDVHDGRREIVQYGLALPVPIRLPEGRS